MEEDVHDFGSRLIATEGGRAPSQVIALWRGDGLKMISPGFGEAGTLALLVAIRVGCMVVPGESGQDARWKRPMKMGVYGHQGLGEETFAGTRIAK